MLTLLRRVLQQRRGAAAAEFALAVPVLVALAAGLFDWGAAAVKSSALRSSARAGLQYAMAHPSDTAGIQNTVLGSLNTTADQVTIATSQACECDGAAAECGSVCPDGSPSEVYVTVTATESLQPVFPGSSMVLPPTLTGSATMRVR
jgi:Flp pilus assembly protein TadG